MLTITDQFPTMEDARPAIHRHVMDEGGFYKVYRSVRSRHILIFKDPTCKSRVQTSLLPKKTPRVSNPVLDGHTSSKYPSDPSPNKVASHEPTLTSRIQRYKAWLKKLFIQ